MEDRRRETRVRIQETGGRSKNSDSSSRNSEFRSQNSDGSSRNSGVRSQESGVGSRSGATPAAQTILKLILLFFLLFTFHFSLFTSADADEIKSKAAVVMDAVTGRVLYAKNPDLRLLPASTTKLMTALVVLDKARLSDVVTISRKAANTAPTKAGLKEGDRVTIETLLYAALMKSANDAAVALAEAVAGSEEQFVMMMNTRAIAIGANDTRFINANGLPGNGQYTTAYDLSKIMRQAIKYPVLKEIIGTRITEVSTETGKSMTIRNTNKLLWSDEELLGGKTGFTQQARHCFVCAGERDKETIIVALLGAPSRGALWKETEDLMAFGAKVMNNSEEPVVYLTKNDRDSTEVTKAVYTRAAKQTVVKAKSRKGSSKNTKLLAQNKKARTAKKDKGVRLASAKKKGKGAVALAGKTKAKKASRLLAKNKKPKRANLAKRAEDGAKG